MTFRNADNFGLQLENLVFMHLRRAAHDIEYVSTENGLETDFLARNRTTGDLNLIQVSIITADDEMTIDDTIHIIPAWKWLLS